MQQPLVSICIPTYNRAATIAQALESALSQDYENLEVVVADNASGDNTREIVEPIAARDPRVRYHRRPGNIGMVANLNDVIRLASGTYRMWLADDDWLDPDLVSTCVRALESDRELALVAGTCKVYRDGTLIGERPATNLMSGSSFARIFMYYATVGDNSVFYGLYRAEIVCQHAMADQQIGADWQFLASVSAHGKVLTTNASSIHRESGGVSSDLRVLAKNFGLTGIFVVEPYLAAAVSAFTDIARDNAVYAQWSRARRGSLALSVFGIVVIRKVLLRRAYRATLFVAKLFVRNDR